jgi:thiosulfate dehydrogenase [quinone] large subunit
VGPKTSVLTRPIADTASDEYETHHVSCLADDVEANNYNLSFTDWLFRSRAASVIWLAVRLVLGYWWLNAGYQKIWGSEKAGFWFGGGAGVKGFATAGVLGSATGRGGASYGWWAGFLHNFVVPNASWIAKVIALGEVAIGIALIIGLFTGLAALAGLLLNVIYMFTGSAGVNPAYAILEVPLVLAWRNAGYLGLDRYSLDAAWWRRHFSGLAEHARRGRTVAVLPPPTSHPEQLGP